MKKPLFLKFLNFLIHVFFAFGAKAEDITIVDAKGNNHVFSEIKLNDTDRLSLPEKLKASLSKNVADDLEASGALKSPFNTTKGYSLKYQTTIGKSSTEYIRECKPNSPSILSCVDVFKMAQGNSGAVMMGSEIQMRRVVAWGGLIPFATQSVSNKTNELTDIKVSEHIYINKNLNPDRRIEILYSNPFISNNKDITSSRYRLALCSSPSNIGKGEISGIGSYSLYFCSRYSYDPKQLTFGNNFLAKSYELEQKRMLRNLSLKESVKLEDIAEDLNGDGRVMIYDTPMYLFRDSGLFIPAALFGKKSLPDQVLAHKLRTYATEWTPYDFVEDNDDDHQTIYSYFKLE